MKTLLLSAVLVTAGFAALAEEPVSIASWSENSGSLPPEYAWDYRVKFLPGGMVEATYCKGYAEEAPGCATVTKQLSPTAQTAMEAAIAPYAAELLANPPQMVSDDQIPIGGGSISGRVQLGETSVALYAFPRPEDAERVQALLQILQDSTPRNLVKKAKNRAKQP